MPRRTNISPRRRSTPPPQRAPHGGASLAERLDREFADRRPRREPKDSSPADDISQLVEEQRRRREAAADVSAIADTSERPTLAPEGAKVHRGKATAEVAAPASGREAHERRKLVAMLKARERHGAEARITAEDVEAQRELIRQLAAQSVGESGEYNRHFREPAKPQQGRPRQGDVSSITWLPAPVPFPGRSRIRLVGWDASVCDRPAWLPADPELAA